MVFPILFYGLPMAFWTYAVNRYYKTYIIAMKKILLIFALVLGIISLSGCGTVAYAATQETDQFGEVTYTTVVTYGEPVYYDGLLSHYVYLGVYYYPYLFGRQWCLQPFVTVQPRGFVFRPHYGFRPEHRFIGHHGTPRMAFRHRGNGYTITHRNSIEHHNRNSYGKPDVRPQGPSSSRMNRFGTGSVQARPNVAVPSRPNGNPNVGRSTVQSHSGALRGAGRGSAGRR